MLEAEEHADDLEITNERAECDDHIDCDDGMYCEKSGNSLSESGSSAVHSSVSPKYAQKKS